MGRHAAAGGADDEDLVAAVGSGDRRALEELYRCNAGWLRLRLEHRCADPGMVEEALQDTFVAIWRQAHRFRGDGEVGAWMWGIAIRRLKDQLRRHGASLRRPEPVDDTTEAVLSAEDQVLLGVEYGDVGGAMNRLSPELRLVVQATVLDGLSSREAAGLLGIPAGTVRTRRARALREMREALA